MERCKKKIAGIAITISRQYFRKVNLNYNSGFAEDANTTNTVVRICDQGPTAKESSAHSLNQGE
jgi:hypothetical protein